MPARGSLLILGYSSDPSSISRTGGDVTYEAKVNPGSFVHKRALQYNEDNTAHTSNDVKQQQGYGAETVEFSLTIDGSGRLNNDNQAEVEVKEIDAEYVSTELNDLCKVVYDYDGNIHKTKYNAVIWGNFQFKCHLLDMNVTYNQFTSEGKCTNATVDLVFVVHEDRETSQKANNNNSPDMSHLKLIKDGDKLPNMCDEIYDDISYYLQIAQANGLTNFRNIPPGKKLVFPPLISD